MMENEEKQIRFLKKLQELAKEKGTSLEDLLGEAAFGELILKAWEEEGHPKQPEEVLGTGLDKLVKDVRRLRENSH